MGDLLAGLKFTLSSGTEKDQFVSLRDLLLRDFKTRSHTQKSAVASSTKPAVVENDSNTGKVVKSRRATRKQIKSKSKPQDFTSPNSTTVQKDVRKKQIEKFIKSNWKALKAAEKNKKGKSAKHPTAPGSSDYKDFIASLEKDVKQPALDSDDVKLPVILALVDFLPITKNGKSGTSAYTTLTFKHATRAMNVDLLIKDARLGRNTKMAEVPIANSLAKFVEARTNFLNSLSLFELTMRKDSHRAFNLRYSNASITEELFTLVRDYACSLKYGTPRINEEPQRVLDSGRMLPSPVGYTNINLCRDILEQAILDWSRQPMSRITNRWIDDHELMTKVLAYIVGKETLYSENIANNRGTFSTGPTNVLDRKLIDPEYLLNINPNATMLDLYWPTSAGDNYTQIGHHILFKSRIDIENRSSNFTNTTGNFPFERSKIAVSSINGVKRTRSAQQFIEDNYGINEESFQSITGKSFRTTYAATLDAMIWANDKITRFSAPDRFSSGGSILYPFYQVLLFTALYTKAGMYDGAMAIHAKVLQLAATDEDVYRRLMVYLAFRQEKVLNYTGQGPAPDGPSKLARKSGWIKQDHIIRTAGSGVTFKTTKVMPSVISLDPAIGGLSTVTAPTVPTKIGVQLEKGTGDAGTLESMYGATFEEVAVAFADLCFGKMMNSTPSGASVPSVGKYKDDTYVTQQLFRDVLISLGDPTGATDVFEHLLNFEEYLNGGPKNPIYDADGKTLFMQIDREIIFSLFVYLTCRLHAIIVPKLFVNRSCEPVPDPYPDIPRTVDIGPGRNHSSPEAFKIRKPKDFPTVLRKLGNWLNDPKKNTSSMSQLFPQLTRIFDTLHKEQQFLPTFGDSLVDYLSGVSNSFDEVLATLDEEANNTSIRRMLNKGLVPSIDMVKLLKQYPGKLNHNSMWRSGTKINDASIKPSEYKKTIKYFSDIDLSEWAAGDSKIMAVGLPAGILESIESEPISLDRVDQRVVDKSDIFELVIQKVDETQPNVEFTELRFPFSRSLFANGYLEKGSDLQMTIVAKDLRPTVASSGNILRMFSTFKEKSMGNDVVANHTEDYHIKKYLDLQYDLDFQENAFPVDTATLRHIVSSDIKIPALGIINLDSAQFLSGSNLLFDPDKLSFKSMEFFDEKESSIDITKKDYDDPYKFSAFDYANTYGVLFDPNQEMDRLKAGTIFEKVLCVMFDDDDFDIKKVNVPEVNTEGLTTEAALTAQTLAEKVAYDSAYEAQEYSPTKLISYRAYITLTAKESIFEMAKGLS